MAGNSASNSPTVINSLAATNAGVIIGTAACNLAGAGSRICRRPAQTSLLSGASSYEMLGGSEHLTAKRYPTSLPRCLRAKPTFASVPQNLNPRLFDFLRRCLHRIASADGIAPAIFAPNWSRLRHHRERHRSGSSGVKALPSLEAGDPAGGNGNSVHGARRSRSVGARAAQPGSIFFYAAHAPVDGETADQPEEGAHAFSMPPRHSCRGLTMENLMVMIRSRRVSRAFHTSPMPLSPMGEMISYGPRLSPGKICMERHLY